jgi:hypothetical protein
MKNRIVILVSILICVGNIHAQGLYLKAGGSIALGWPWTYSSNEGYNEFVMSTTGTVVTSKNTNFGLGFSPNVSAGYMFNQNIGAELGFGYQIGINRVNENVLINATTYKTYKSETRIKCSWMWVNPQLVIATSNTAFSPYGRVGVVFGFAPKMVVLVENVDDFGVRKTEISGGMPWGFNAAFGANFKLKNNCSFFGEFEMLQMNYSPETSEITEYKSSTGVDVLASLTEKSKKTQFTDSWSSTDIANDQPNKAAKINLPLSSFKINVGIRFNF